MIRRAEIPSSVTHRGAAHSCAWPTEPCMLVVGRSIARLSMSFLMRCAGECGGGRWSKSLFVPKSMVRQQEQCFVVAFRWKFSRSPQTVLRSKRVTLANIRSLSTRQTRSGSQKLLRLRSRFSTRSFTPPGTYAPILPGCSASQP